jgi:hypothetical protein
VAEAEPLHSLTKQVSQKRDTDSSVAYRISSIQLGMKHVCAT